MARLRHHSCEKDARASLARVFVVALPVASALAFFACNANTPPVDDDFELPQRAEAGDGGASDGATLPEAAADAASPTTPTAPACDKSKPFGAPTRVPNTDGTVLQATPRMSSDELSMYFTTRDAEGTTHLAKIVRTSKTAPFGAMALLTAQNSTSSDNDPAPAADHLSIWFQSSRSGTVDLFVASRATLTEDFGPPQAVPGVNTSAVDAHAYYRAAGGGELWFVSNRAGDTFDIYVAKRQGTAFGAPAVVPELSSDADDYQPQISEDGLTALLSSTRAGGMGSADLWIATRAAATSPFNAPTPLSELNSSATDQAGWISADGCRIYFSSTRDAIDHDQLYFAERPK